MCLTYKISCFLQPPYVIHETQMTTVLNQWLLTFVLNAIKVHHLNFLLHSVIMHFDVHGGC
jgi:hypothetical protein